MSNLAINPVFKGEPLQYVDATPDAEYVLRILRAHLHNVESGGWEGHGSKRIEELCAAMNLACKKRAALLRAAIAKLTPAGGRR